MIGCGLALAGAIQHLGAVLIACSIIAVFVTLSCWKGGER